MINRFQDFTSYITQAYKYMLKIKTHEMKTFGLKASHVMCLFFIGKHKDGLTAVELCTLCNEDKAGISKSLAELRRQEFITVDNDNGTKVYRTKYLITDKGEEVYQKISDFIVRIVDECGKNLTLEERDSFYRSLKLITLNLKSYYERLEGNNESYI